METESFSKTRSSLIARLQRPRSAAEKEEAFAEFFRLYRRLVEDAARKAGVAEHDVDDILQETMASVTQKILRFELRPGVGTFRGWIRTITQNKSFDHHRKRKRIPSHSVSSSDATSTTPTIGGVPDPNPVDLAEICDSEIASALLAEGLRRLKEKNWDAFQVFQHAIIDGKPAAEVALLTGKNRAQVYLLKHRALKEWRRIEGQIVALIKARPA